MARRQSITKIYSAFTDGIVGIVSEIEVSLSPGIPTFEIIGLCDSSIRESRGRIKASLLSSGFSMPSGHIVISISPAYMHKSGSGFDLAIALGILAVSNQLSIPNNKRIYAEGELSLDGSIKETPSSALRLQSASSTDFDYIFVPKQEEASARCAGLTCYLVDSLKECSDVLVRQKNTPISLSLLPSTFAYEDETTLQDYSSLVGQNKALRAILIAACGWHNLLLVGSPGCGKTMAGKLISTILPSLSDSEIAEVFSIRNALGDSELDNKRPFRYIHQSITTTKLLGLSTKLKPGELSLANRGVLFADELCEYKSGVLDSLRQPLEDREIVLNKDGKKYFFPTDFIFVGATNPCKCGNFYESGNPKCSCSEADRQRYISKLSGPLLDRIDLFTTMHRVNSSQLDKASGENSKVLSKQMRQTVERTWEIQKKRATENGQTQALNGVIRSENLADVFRADKKTIEYCVELANSGNFSVRGYIRLLRVGRTIADIEGHTDLQKSDVAEAYVYRNRCI